MPRYPQGAFADTLGAALALDSRAGRNSEGKKKPSREARVRRAFVEFAGLPKCGQRLKELRHGARATERGAAPVCVVCDPTAPASPFL
jgi:hypothetical protein